MSGVERRFHLDSNGKDITVETYQDVEAIIEHNKLLRSMEQRSDWGRHVASVPVNILYQWMHESGLMYGSPEFNEYVERKLKDPEFAYLKTESSHVSGFIGFRK